MSNKKVYTKIEFGLGNLEGAIKELSHFKVKNELVYGTFNGVDLHSDTDDIESAYLKVTGKTKKEFDAYQKEQSDKYEKEKLEHQASIPQQTIEYIKKGNEILDEKYHTLWAECVPIRLSDLSRGFELQCCLDIVKELNAGVQFSEIKPLLDKQGHSGRSFGLLCSMLESFAERGKEFVDFVR